MRIVSGSDNGVVKVTWFEGRRVVGVWGEARARCAVDTMCKANDDASTVGVGLQDGTIALLAVGDTVAQFKELLKQHQEQQQQQQDVPPPVVDRKPAHNASSSSSSKKSNAELQQGPQPFILPELARFRVALPPAPRETETQLGKLKRGAGGNRSVESASSVSRFAGLCFVDNYSR
jgi:hypothetical protein